MPLESLLELVETLRARIDEHGAALRQNEMRTRYALIDPLLQGLGWDISNPSEVMIEDGSGDGRADYLLLDNGNPVMIIEAKRLGLGVSDGRQQAVNYAMDPGRRARYFSVTDGNQWEIYDTHQPAISMLVISFALKEDAPAEVCLKAMALWRPTVEQGSVITAETPLVGLDTVKLDAPKTVDLPTLEPEPTPPPQPVQARDNIREQVARTTAATIEDASDTAGWISVSDLDPTPGTKPAELLFPDNARANTTTWASFVPGIVGWLLARDLINETHYPIQRGRRFILAPSPTHPNGKDFAQGKQVGYLHVETQYQADHHALNARTIIERVGLNPADFKVRLA